MHKILTIFDVVFLLHLGLIKVSIIFTSLSGTTKHDIWIPINIKNLKLPEHSVSPQERFSRDWPSQLLPPYLGEGESQFLSLNCTPPPQDTLQVE